MKVSVILPTRKRVGLLRRSLTSLLERKVHAEIEILLGVDDDDSETLAALDLDPIPFSRVVVGPRYGYENLHVYVNRLAFQAKGDWLFLWNDDAFMETVGWDDRVQEFEGQMVVVNPGTNHLDLKAHECVFPIVPRRMVEILGHFSQSNHSDTYVQDIANILGIRRNVAVNIYHDRADLTGQNEDEVFLERVYTSEDYYGPSIQALIRSDAEKLRPFLDASQVLSTEVVH